MSRIYIETDLVAHDVGQHLATANYAIAAARGGAELDYSFGLRAALTARTLSSLVLDNLDNEKSDDYARFRDFSREAMKLQDEFWKVFRLVVLVNANGVSRMVQAQPIAQVSVRPPQAPVRHINGSKQRERMTQERRDALRKDIKERPSNTPKSEWFDYLAGEYKIPVANVWYYDKAMKG